MAFYGVWRLSTDARALVRRATDAKAPLRSNRMGTSRGGVPSYLGTILRRVLALGALIVLGLGLAAVQLVPLYELAAGSFRQGAQDYTTIVGYAYPAR